MSKTITVPDIGQYPIKINLNCREYTLWPGTETTVPDGVAKLLDQIVASKPQPTADGWKNAWATIKDAEQYGGGGSGGGSIIVDDELSDTSENPVQNKVVTAALAAAENFDVTITPTETEGVFTADKTIAQIQAAVTAHKNVRAFMFGGNSGYVLPFSMMDSGEVVFGSTFSVDSGVAPNAIFVRVHLSEGVEVASVYSYNLAVEQP